MHALHNAHLLRKTLPLNLTAPIPCFTDRDTKHREFAALLRVSEPAKRATALKKAKETQEKKQGPKKGEDWPQSQRSTRILMRQRINRELAQKLHAAFGVLFNTPSDALEQKKYSAVCGFESRMRFLRKLSNVTVFMRWMLDIDF
ncbi:hypothetical protein B0H17DRAFT_1143989 [Mycena rosella]|uniref:Uncharacterized protein n=1 Tax=Mycena rosella TaxID=1033263 RepID=A0AAD7CTL2_MYCRO|nr:hypothetical protein B0H17DRAFT_1143989 [Mycena rosella]